MTDRRPDDDDHAWLLARERGQPGPAIDDARARRYGQLGSQIADLPALPAGAVSREGWEQAVLAAIDAKDPPAAVIEPPPKKHRRRVAAAAAFAMVACAAIVVLVRRPGTPPDGPEVTRGI